MTQHNSKLSSLRLYFKILRKMERFPIDEHFVLSETKKYIIINIIYNILLLVYNFVIFVVVKDYWSNERANSFDISLIGLHQIALYCMLVAIPFLNRSRIATIYVIVRELQRLNLKLRRKGDDSPSRFEQRLFCYCANMLFLFVIRRFYLGGYVLIYIGRILDAIALYGLYCCFEFATIACEYQLSYLDGVRDMLNSLGEEHLSSETLSCFTDISGVSEKLRESYGFHILLYLVFYSKGAFCSVYYIGIRVLDTNIYDMVQTSVFGSLLASFVICISCCVSHKLNSKVILQLFCKF